MLCTSSDQQFHDPSEHQDGAGNQLQSFDRLFQQLVILGQPPKARQPGKRALDHPAARQQDKAAFGLGMFDDHQPDAPAIGLARGLIARMALVDVGHFHGLTRRVLDGFGHLRDLLAIRSVRWGDDEREELPERVNRQMQLRPLLALVAVIATAIPVLDRAVQRAAVNDRRRGLLVLPFPKPNQHAQILDEGLEAVRRVPFGRRQRWLSW